MARVPPPPYIPKILKAFGRFKEASQNLERVRLRGKVFRNKALRAISWRWKDWIVLEVINRGQQAL